MKTLSLKLFVLPFLMMLVFASCSKEEITKPGSTEVALVVEKGGDEDIALVRSTVTNSAQQNVVGATVTLYIGTTVYMRGTTNSSGVCAFSDVEFGSYTFEIVASGYVTVSEPISVSADVVRQDELVEL